MGATLPSLWISRGRLIANLNSHLSDSSDQVSSAPQSPCVSCTASQLLTYLLNTDFRSASCSFAVQLNAAGTCTIAVSDDNILSFPIQAEGKAVLITGCDKGFGHALAKQLHAKGFTVFAGCLLAVSDNTDQNSSGTGETFFSSNSLFICSFRLP